MTAFRRSAAFGAAGLRDEVVLDGAARACGYFWPSPRPRFVRHCLAAWLAARAALLRTFVFTSSWVFVAAFTTAVSGPRRRPRSLRPAVPRRPGAALLVCLCRVLLLAALGFALAAIGIFLAPVNAGASAGVIAATPLGLLSPWRPSCGGAAPRYWRAPRGVVVADPPPLDSLVWGGFPLRWSLLFPFVARPRSVTLWRLLRGLDFSPVRPPSALHHGRLLGVTVPYLPMWIDHPCRLVVRRRGRTVGGTRDFATNGVTPRCMTFQALR